MKRAPSHRPRVVESSALRCERCGVSLRVELVTVDLCTPDGGRRLCASCTRVVLDLLDRAQVEAGAICEEMWRVEGDA